MALCGILWANRYVIPAKAGIHPRVVATMKANNIMFTYGPVTGMVLLYTGVTSDLMKRIYEHKEGLVQGFTKKQIKKWNRQWKSNLIEQDNPQWLNLANGLLR
jgi:putative endonuclease